MILAIIQARMGSSRLPGKIFKEINNKPILRYVVDRVSYSSEIDKIVVATTENNEDSQVNDYCNLNGILCFKGSENDVLDRYYKCAKKFNAKKNDVIVRITSDCPLIDPVVIDKVIKEYKKSNVDYVSNVNPPTYPDGLDVEAFSFDSLEYAWENAKNQLDREHVTLYIRENENLFKSKNVENEIDLSGMRWTLDNIEDFDFISSIYNNFLNEKIFYFNEIVEFLKSKQELLEINNMYSRNEGLKKQKQETK